MIHFGAGGLFTWTPKDKSKVQLGFLATDGKSNATLEPIVKLCDCMNEGTCLFDQYASGTNLLQDRFAVSFKKYRNRFCLFFDRCINAILSSCIPSRVVSYSFEDQYNRSIVFICNELSYPVTDFMFLNAVPIFWDWLSYSYVCFFS